MAVYCPKCGKKLPDYAEFCDNCGTRIPKTQEEPKRTAPVRETGKKKSSVLGKIVKWFVILNLIGAAVMLVPALLESVFHRTPPAQQTTSDFSTHAAAPWEDTPKENSPASQPAADVQTPEQDVSQGLEDITNVWFDDFLFYENDVYNNGIPAGAVLREAGYISGEWKYCMTFNRTIAGEERIDEIGTAEVAFSEQGAQLILHPQYIRYGSDVSPENEAEVGYEPFAGTWDPEYIDLSDGRISIGLGPYYSYEGRDYVLGNIVIRDTGMFGDVLLVRP